MANLGFKGPVSERASGPSSRDELALATQIDVDFIGPTATWRQRDHNSPVVVAVLKQAELGMPVAELIRRVGISEQTFYRWKKVSVGNFRFAHDPADIQVLSRLFDRYDVCMHDVSILLVHLIARWPDSSCRAALDPLSPSRCCSNIRS